MCIDLEEALLLCYEEANEYELIFFFKEEFLDTQNLNGLRHTMLQIRQEEEPLLT